MQNKKYEDKVIDAILSLKKNTIVSDDGIVVAEVRFKTVTRKGLSGKMYFDEELSDKTTCAIFEISDSKNCQKFLTAVDECHIQGVYYTLSDGGCLIHVEDVWFDVKHSFVFKQTINPITEIAVPL